MSDIQEESSEDQSKNKGIRLNRYLANSGVCSRRKADVFIAKGLVTVNGEVVTEMGFRVQPNDKVEYEGKVQNAEKKRYVLLNKPRNCVSTMDDPEGRRTVFDLIAHATEERIYPVGRLDRNTTGVLLFTNDGDLAKKLTHPSYNKKKIYHAFLDKPFTAEDLREIRKGFELEDGFAQADAADFPEAEDKSQVGLEIHSGKNRIVRRMFEHLGYKVEKLDRVVFAGLTKKNLPRTKWRFLTEKEVQFLKMQ